MLKTFTPRGLFALVVVFIAAAVIAVSVSGASAQTAPQVRHATGTFEVAVTPADPEVFEAGLGLSRFALTKTFSGGLTGSGTGQMLAGGPSETTGAYVALERFVGTLDGRSGAFLMAHRGDMSPEGYSLSITVVPNSGTGALTGIAGDFSLTIADGVHAYDLAYSLPQ